METPGRYIALCPNRSFFFVVRPFEDGQKDRSVPEAIFVAICYLFWSKFVAADVYELVQRRPLSVPDRDFLSWDGFDVFVLLSKMHLSDHQWMACQALSSAGLIWDRPQADRQKQAWCARSDTETRLSAVAKSVLSSCLKHKATRSQVAYCASFLTK